MPRKTATTWKTVTRTATCLAILTRRGDARRRIRAIESWIRSKGCIRRRAKRWRMLRKFGLPFVSFIYFPWRTNADFLFYFWYTYRDVIAVCLLPPFAFCYPTKFQRQTSVAAPYPTKHGTPSHAFPSAGWSANASKPTAESYSTPPLSKN